MTEKYFMVTSATTAEDLKKQRDELLLTNKLHPDHGGSHEQFVELDRQYDQALELINVFHVFRKADVSGRQFLYDLIDGIAYMLAETKKYSEFSISIGVNIAKGIVNSVDANKWALFLMRIINRKKP